MPSSQSTSEIRVGVINEGHPAFYLYCKDEDDAERTRESWSKDPDPNAEVWIERRVIGPWHPVRVVPLDDAESLAVALASISDLRKTWPSAARALDAYRSHRPRGS